MSNLLCASTIIDDVFVVSTVYQGGMSLTIETKIQTLSAHNTFRIPSL